MKKALITGITGQSGAYLTRLLISKGYEIHGIKRRSSLLNTQRIDDFYQDPHVSDRNLILHYGDLSDATNIIRIVQDIRPDEVYNLGAMSHVKVSFEQPEYCADINGLGVLRLLEAIRITGLDKTKIYQASTSELFGMTQEVPQNELTAFYPRSPYAVAKLYAYWITVNYREAYDMFACNGILFNHESPLRGETFVTRKITRAVARIVLGLQKKLFVGNLNARRDWGHAKDYVECMWKILQQDEPEDWVIATGVTTSVKDFIRMAFKVAGIELQFTGKDDKEVGVISRVEGLQNLSVGDVVVGVDPNYYRPTEVDLLIGDASKARKKLGWKPKYDVESLCEEMVTADLKLFQKEQFLKNSGYHTRFNSDE